MSLLLLITALDKLQELVILYSTINRSFSSYSITGVRSFGMREQKLYGDLQAAKRTQRIKDNSRSIKRETQEKIGLRQTEREQKGKGLSSPQSPESVPSQEQPGNDSPNYTYASSKEPSRLNFSKVPGAEKTRPPEPFRYHPLGSFCSNYSSLSSSPPAKGRRKSFFTIPVSPASSIDRCMLSSQREENNNGLLTDHYQAVSLPGNLRPHISQHLPADDASSRLFTEALSQSRRELPIQEISGGQRVIEPIFLSLPLEVRKRVYGIVSREAWHFTGERPHSISISAISLARVNHQLNREMHIIPYELADVHVYDWGTFVLWLTNRSDKQRLAITILFVHVTIFLENVRDQEDFKEGKPTHTVCALKLTVWPTLDRLKKVLVLIHPYRPTLQPALRDPRQELDQIIWNIRAHNIAISYTDQVRLLHREDGVEFVGRWSEPRSSHNLDRMDKCWKSGFFIRDTDGYWGCMSPSCKYLWESKLDRIEHRK
ncbi:hypothetical protein BDU57DRAFT_542458 [Ampelomyces quisqualis]|uniref:Uncharacterized protein n=1 Tax=Ampelomyces quisqualis TaxID=50730 RepID=A0A6A5QCP6_AMPQU|nr:hypothetical protein BDU57DRAFT_542458 [Ampelomyces quisqualis]